ncbi:MAG: DUF5706 domain-containing protein [candidate division KSB1 bacterium]|nr:DUF5706 domain-containing protein [candidate division KSB1 bacterium]MDZ7273438.1 DUF5706 domain-containing protein [candidate division KSB1 bacterium]MDZ7286970.1 DUF5706 domain-containing protein [candidate division KSB1 bacterium]MDZ7299677.1 DUF5706 domain-containing protein [candidate division KSB1 bacterium]MDZ7307941.1 DUF5706 domain-containing protein [candidate division KSB1 bacterium]
MIDTPDGSDNLTPKKKKKEKTRDRLKAKNADRAMDNLFRIVLNTHLQLSAMADNKANMLITVSALILSLSLVNFNDPTLQPAIISMGLTCVATILLAVYATLPNLPPRLPRPDPQSPGFNIIFFGYFSQLEYPVFAQEMQKVINDRSRVYDSLARDLYNLGKVLGDRKYRFIRMSYLVFMTGLVISFVILLTSLAITASVPVE